MNAKQDEYCTQSQLLRKGWSKTMIAKHLGEPDLTNPNPINQKWAPVKRYKRSRVEWSEKSEAFQQDLERSRARSLSSGGRKAAETRRQRDRKWAKEVELEIQSMRQRHLLKAAIDHFNNRQDCESPEVIYATEKSDPEFLFRIQVNLVRHNLTNYEDLLSRLFGRIDQNSLYIIIRNRINNEIVSRHPWLLSLVYKSIKK